MELKGKKILAFIEADFEDLEMSYPVLRLNEAGAHVDIAGLEGSKQYIGKYGVPMQSDISFKGVQAADYDGLVVPGGWAPDKLRRYEDVLRITREFHEAGKPIAHICHAGWVLVSAGICKGYKMTSTPGIKDDMINAGATWINEEVVVDRHIVSSRRPSDLPAMMREYIKLLAGK